MIRNFTEERAMTMLNKLKIKQANSSHLQYRHTYSSFPALTALSMSRIIQSGMTNSNLKTQKIKYTKQSFVTSKIPVFNVLYDYFTSSKLPEEIEYVTSSAHSIVWNQEIPFSNIIGANSITTLFSQTRFAFFGSIIKTTLAGMDKSLLHAGTEISIFSKEIYGGIQLGFLTGISGNIIEIIGKPFTRQTYTRLMQNIVIGTTIKLPYNLEVTYKIPLLTTNKLEHISTSLSLDLSKLLRSIKKYLS